MWRRRDPLTGRKRRAVDADREVALAPVVIREQIHHLDGEAPVDHGDGAEVIETQEGAANRGVTDIDALISASPQPFAVTTKGGYLLYRVGDAVSSRSVHAALLDAYRISIAL